MEYEQMLEDAKSFLFGWFAGADLLGDNDTSIGAAIETAVSLMHERMQTMVQNGGTFEDIKARLIGDLTASIDSIKADIQ